MRSLNVMILFHSILLLSTLCKSADLESPQPSVLPHGVFASLATSSNPSEIFSDNREYRCNFKQTMFTEMTGEITDFVLYENNHPVLTIEYHNASGVSVSNAGHIVFYEFVDESGKQLVINAYTKEGKKVFRKTFSHAHLFGFSSKGNMFGVGTTQNFYVLHLLTEECFTYPAAHQFSISPDETVIALAHEKEIALYSRQNHIANIDHFSDYIRKICISGTNACCGFIDKKNLYLYSLSDRNRVFHEKLDTFSSFSDLRLYNSVIWAGIQYRNREERVSRGILKTYSLSGTVLGEEICSEKHYPPKRTLNYDYDTSAGEVPWPYEPFDQATKSWNSYLQLSASSDGNNKDAYCHQGLDMDVPTKARTHSVARGYVKARLTLGGDSYWRVAIADKNTSDSTDGWLYAHLIKNSIAVNVGDRVEQGDFLGEIIKWSGLPGGHLHFSRIRDKGTTWKGKWRNSANPMMFLRPHGDTDAPKIEPCFSYSKFGFSTNDASSNVTYLKPDNLKGKIDILVKVDDKCGTSPWNQEATTIYYWIKNAETGKEILPRTLALSRTQGMPDYSGNLYNTLSKVLHRVDNTFPVKGWFTKKRTYVHVITNNNGDSVITANEKNLAFATDNHPDGTYRIVVEVSDAAGNTTIDSQNVVFNNGITDMQTKPHELITEFRLNRIQTNRTNGRIQINFQLPRKCVITLNLFDMQGKVVHTVTAASFNAGKHSIVWDNTGRNGKRITDGMYLLKFQADIYSSVQKVTILR